MSDLSIESTLRGMTAKRAVFKLAEVIAVARRGHSWEWIANWLSDKGVVSQRGVRGSDGVVRPGVLSPESLSNYFSEAKKNGLVDEKRVEALVKVLDEKIRSETLKEAGTVEAIELLLKTATSNVSQLVASAHQAIQSKPEEPTGIAIESRPTISAVQVRQPDVARGLAAPVVPRAAGDIKGLADGFGELREVVRENLKLPPGKQSEYFDWRGSRRRIGIDQQRSIADGSINSIEELLAAKK